MAKVSLDEALSGFRRGTHVHRHHWSAYVLCKTEMGMKLHYDEIERRLNGSSTPVQTASPANRTLVTSKGSIVRFGMIGDMADVDLRLRSLEFPQIIFLYEPDHAVLQSALTRLRSPVVPPEQYRMDMVID